VRTVLRSTGSLLLVGGLVLVGLPVARGAGVESDEGEAVLAEAYEAARHHDFRGVVEVEWSDGNRYHAEQVPVRAVDGVIEIDGARTVVATARGHFVREHDRWIGLWGGDDLTKRPEPGNKYEFVVGTGRQVAGRPTTTVEIRHDGELRERAYIDDETGIILRREQYDHAGEPQRVLTFRDVELVTDGDVPAVPSLPEGPEPADEGAAGNLPAPAVVGEGWALQASYTLSDGTVQRYYTDGVFGLSLFEQEGELDWNALPAGDQMELDGHTARRFVGPSGAVVVWEMDGVVYTSVSEVPVDEVAAIADDLGGGDSFFARALRFVLSPFSLF